MTSPAALSSIDSPHSRAHGHSRRPSTSWFHHRTENHLRPFSVIAVVMILILLRADTALAADPTDLFATVSGSLVTFRWQGDGALWVIEAGSAPGLADVGVIQFASTTRIRGFSNVPPGTYYVRVRAVVDGAAGPPSNEVVVVVGCSWGELDLRSTVLGLQVQLVWSAIGVIQGVQLEAGTAPGLSDVAVVLLPRTSDRLTATAAPGTYYVRVRPIGLCGAGPPSNEVRVNAGSGLNCVPTLSPFHRVVRVSGVYTVSIALPSGCAWDVFTRDRRWITPITTSGVGSGTIQYRVTLPGGGVGQLYITTSSGRYYVNVES
jgi:hypothetical protein